VSPEERAEKIIDDLYKQDRPQPGSLRLAIVEHIRQAEKQAVKEFQLRVVKDHAPESEDSHRTAQ